MIRLGNNIKEELNKIPIPSQLHKRSQLGILKAKEEMGEIKKENKIKKKTNFYLAASVLLPMLVYGTMVLYDHGVQLNQEKHTVSSSPPRISSIPKNNSDSGKQYDLAKDPKIDIAGYMSANFIFSGKVMEVTTFQKQGQTLIKIKVDLAQTYRGLLKKGNPIIFVARKQTSGSPSINVKETYLFCGILPPDPQLYVKEVGGEYYFLLSALQGTEAEKVVKELEK